MIWDICSTYKTLWLFTECSGREKIINWKYIYIYMYVCVCVCVCERASVALYEHIRLHLTYDTAKLQKSFIISTGSSHEYKPDAFSYSLRNRVEATSTPLRRVLLEKLPHPQLAKKFPTFYGTEGSLPHSQAPTTCPYPESDQSSLCPHPTSWRSILILSSHLHLFLPNDYFHTPPH